MERRRGFTLIELLVVIAIIGILAAMLFPVFARARESARKIQCLSNVKNIAIAFQMYLADYDRMPPGEHRQEVIDYFCASRANQPNPYLPVPVILDEYIKNRDVWACPASRWHAGFAINPGLGSGGWFGYFLQYESSFWDYAAPCNYTFPPGWGGAVTDSALQETTSDPDQGGFKQDIGINLNMRDLPTNEINDVAKYVVVADIGAANYEFNKTERCSYVDTNMWARAACQYPVADWENCSWTRECGAGDPRFQIDPQFRKTHAQARHLGGVNLGFADGHATWMNAEAVAFGGEQWCDPSYATATNLLEGVRVCGFGPPNDAAIAFLNSLK